MANGTSPVTQAPRPIFVPYTYVATGATLAQNASGQIPLLLDQDADFELHWLTAYSDADNPVNPRSNNFTFQVMDKNNSRIWSSLPVAEVALIPRWVLARPVLLARRSNLNFQFYNLYAGNMTPTVVMHGFKVIQSQQGNAF
jgi:hypothetical protein